MFLLITSRPIELEGCATSQIVGNSNAILNLSNFFEIDEELAEILPLEVVLMLTKFLGSTIHFGFLGSGPDRGRSPVEWGDFPFVRTYVLPYVRISIYPAQEA